MEAVVLDISGADEGIFCGVGGCAKAFFQKLGP